MILLNWYKKRAAEQGVPPIIMNNSPSYVQTIIGYFKLKYFQNIQGHLT